MTVDRPGTPDGQLYTGECPACKCLLTATRAECSLLNLLGAGPLLRLPCPTCKNMIVMKVKE
jgi:hypothetical protein